ncbi:hypothetical protein BN1708_010613 [Verticillium longisporum]|uniref:Uncharacterized protein n=1 Tax=Verticillium longisporum TaxID=100787 RepID=A0A0G4KSL1_VERLO|nr:hypothetical protein BN1708_010613 [Verticillium longisporum]
MTHDQSAQTEAGHSAAMALQSQAIKDSRFANVSFTGNGGSSSDDLAGRLDYDLWSLIQHFDKARRTLDAYRDAAQKENLERSYILQQQHNNLNARWSSSYGELQKEAQKKARDLQKVVKELENARAELEEKKKESQLNDMAVRELQETVEMQNIEIVRAREIHAQLDSAEKELAECRSVNQAVEAVLEMKKTHIVELESALGEMTAKNDRLAAGTTPAELIGQNRALEQQLRELQAENKALAERLAQGMGAQADRDGSSRGQCHHNHCNHGSDEGKEQVPDANAGGAVEGEVDAGKAKKRKRTK